MTAPIRNHSLTKKSAPSQTSILADEQKLAQEARRVLRRLCESGAVLAVAVDMEKAAVLRSHGDAPPTRTAVVDRETAHAFALKEWISCLRSGRVTTYEISAAGRTALKNYLAEDLERRRSKTDGMSPFADSEIEWSVRAFVDGDGAIRRKMRCNMAESPLAMLARRRDKNGQLFLEAGLVQSGERFREDFELAQLAPKVAQNWDKFINASDRSDLTEDDGLPQAPRAARERVLAALDDLGPGLSDILMRCCCFLEGLEAAEKRMGWSARSGKIVLRIALQRLHRHYTDTQGHISPMIG